MSETELEQSTEVNTGSSVDSTVDDMRWYVVQAYSGFEKRVQLSLQTRIDRSDLKDQFGQVLVPTEDVVELKNGQKRTSERKFFPGYVLVQMTMSDAAWHLVKSVPRVSGFVGGTSTQPVPISDQEAQAILQQVVEGAEHPRPKYTFAPGEVVRVTDGPFQEFNGTVEDVNFEKSKLRVAVTIFGRSTPVELSFSQVEKG
jgi:transcriptional antiterminator NusG